MLFRSLGSAYVPALSPAGEGGAVLTERGYGVLKGGVLAGFLEGEAAKGLELLAGGPAADIIEAELAGAKVSVKTASARTESALAFQGGEPSALKLTCRIEARLSEYRERPAGQALAALQTELARRERDRLETALSQLRAMGADCAGLGAKAGMFCPARWQAVQADWPEWFSRVPLEITVEVEIL